MIILDEWLITGPSRAIWLWVNDFQPWWIEMWPSICWHLGNKSPEHEAPIFTARSPRHWLKWKCSTSIPEKVFKNVWLNPMSLPVIQHYMYHGSCVMYMGLMCHSCVELQLNINTKWLFKRVLNPAHPSLLSPGCWPWGVLSSWLVDHGFSAVHDSQLAREGPVLTLVYFLSLCPIPM